MKRSRLARVSVKGRRRNAELEKTKRIVRERSGGTCEIRYTDPDIYCGSDARDYHHIIKRSRGRDDSPENLIHVCRYHHEKYDRSWDAGRLVTLRVGERFASRVFYAEHKGQGQELVAAWKASLQ